MTINLKSYMESVRRVYEEKALALEGLNKIATEMDLEGVLNNSFGKWDGEDIHGTLQPLLDEALNDKELNHDEHISMQIEETDFSYAILHIIYKGTTIQSSPLRITLDEHQRVDVGNIIRQILVDIMMGYEDSYEASEEIDLEEIEWKVREANNLILILGEVLKDVTNGSSHDLISELAKHTDIKGILSNIK